MKIQDITGQRFGKLKVLNFAYKEKGVYYWLCQCDCGKEKIISRNHLQSLHTKSCGCLQKEKARNFHLIHNMANSRIYHIWRDIKDRCLNMKKQNYKYYGGRGIRVCEEWKNDFMNFYNWAMANGYNDKLTIDRRNNDGNYEPNNCRWTTKQEQANNTRRNRYITYKGKTQSLANWCRELKLNYKLTKQRIQKHSPEQAFEKGIKENENKNRTIWHI